MDFGITPAVGYQTYLLNISVIYYKHLGFRVRISSSFLGRAKTERIVTLRVSDAETNRTASLCKLSRRDVCLSELCLLQTKYNCGTRPRGPSFFHVPSSVTEKARHSSSASYRLHYPVLWPENFLEKLRITSLIKKFPVLWNPQVQYRVQKSSTLDAIMRQPKLIRILSSCFSKVHFNDVRFEVLTAVTMKSAVKARYIPEYRTFPH
jgi:hypothetical protein